MSEFSLDLSNAVINSVWQGAALTAAAWAAFHGLGRLGPRLRHAGWVAVFAAVVILPLGSLLPLRGPVGPAARQTSTALPESPALRLDPVFSRAVPAADSRISGGDLHRGFRVAEIPGAWASRLLTFWCVLSALLLIRVARRAHALQSIKRSSCEAAGDLAALSNRWTRSLGPGRQARLLVSEEIEGPLLAGLGRPAVILPRELERRLDRDELRAVWLHEMAHLRRADDWLELGAQVLIALFPLQPALPLVKRWADQAREEACDAWVVGHTGDGPGYAECLLKLAEWRWAGSMPAASLSIAGNARGMTRRIQMLSSQNRVLGPAISRTILVLFLLFMALNVGMLMQAPAAVLFAQVAEEVRTTTPEAPHERREKALESSEQPPEALPARPSATPVPLPTAVLPEAAANPISSPQPEPFPVAAALPQPPAPPQPLAAPQQATPQAPPATETAPADPAPASGEREIRELSDEVAELATSVGTARTHCHYPNALPRHDQANPGKTAHAGGAKNHTVTSPRWLLVA